MRFFLMLMLGASSLLTAQTPLWQNYRPGVVASYSEYSCNDSVGLRNGSTFQYCATVYPVSNTLAPSVEAIESHVGPIGGRIRHMASDPNSGRLAIVNGKINTGYNTISIKDGNNWITLDQYNTFGDYRWSYTINAVAFDANGFLYVAANNGIYRYDGSRFTLLLDGTGSVEYDDMLADNNGNLWIRTNFGAIISYDGNAFVEQDTAFPILPYQEAVDIAVAYNGDVWAALGNFGLAKFDGTNWSVYNYTNSSLPNDNLATLTVDLQNVVWATSNREIYRFNGVTCDTLTSANTPIPPLSGVSDPYADPYGSVWIDGQSLFRYNNGMWETYTSATAVWGEGYMYAPAPNGTLWLSANTGSSLEDSKLFNIDGATFTPIANSNASLMREGGVDGIYIDPTGKTWINSQGRITNFNNGVFNYSNSYLEYDDITIDASGAAYLVSGTSIRKIYNGVTTNYGSGSSGNFYGGDYGKAIALDKRGNIFVGGHYGIAKKDIATNLVTSYYRPLPLSQPNVQVVDLELDSAGNIWFASNRGFGKIDTAGILFLYDEDNTVMTDEDVHDITVDSEGNVWACSTYDLMKISPTGSITRYPVQFVYSLATGKNGTVWLGAANEIIKFNGVFFETPIPILHDFNLPFVRCLAVDTAGNILVGDQYDGLSVYLGDTTTIFASNVISGKIFRDANNDGVLNGNEYPLAFQPVVINPGNIIVYTDFDGNYEVPLASPGSYTLSYSGNTSQWQITSDSSIYHIGLPSLTDYDSLDFALQSIGSTVDVTTSIFFSNSRCSENGQIQIGFTNTGNVPGDVSLTLEVDTHFSVNNINPAPTSVNGNLYTWDFVNVQPYLPYSIGLNHVNPGVQAIGDTSSSFVWAAIVDPLNSQTTYDSSYFNSVITCAYDPNDKLVSQGANSLQDMQGYALAEKPLVYSIRFQNTGNDTAVNVVILDTLESGIDASSFKLLGASHSVQVQNENGMIRFIFNNIMLPDSGRNLLASQGFVSFEVNISSTVVHGDSVLNSASIYFDANPPILTNQTVNTVLICDSINRFVLNDTSICQNTAFQAEYSGFGAASFLWVYNNDTIGTNDVLIQNASSAGVSPVYLTTRFDDCVRTESKMVEVKPLPTPALSIAGTQAICAGDQMLVSLPSADTIIWYQDNNTINTALDTFLTVASNGIYYAQVGINGCVAYSDTLSLTVNVLPAPPTITGDTAICQGDTAILEAPGGYVDYLWSGGQTTQQISVLSGGTVSVQVTDQNNCTSPSSANLTVTVNPLPTTPAVNGDTAICQGDTAVLEAPGGYSGYLWSGGQTTQQISVLSGGTVSVQVIDLNNCTSPSSANLTVSVNPLPMAPTITGDTAICQGDTAILEAPGGYVGYLWSGGQTTQQISVLNGGTVSVQVTDLNNCTSPSSANFSVHVNSPPPAPVVLLSGSPVFCNGDSIVLTAPAGLASYIWSNGDTSQTIEVDESGTFAVAVMDGNGCWSDSSLAVLVTVNDVPATPTITAQNDTLTASILADSYQWYFNGNLLSDTTMAIVADSVGDYTVVAIENGCISGTSTSFSYLRSNVEERYKNNMKISVYPNPHNNNFTVSWQGEELVTSVKLINAVGQTVHLVEDKGWQLPSGISINTSGLSAGLYFIVLEGQHGIATYKVIKE